MSVKYADLVAKAIKSFGAQRNWNKITGQCRLIEAKEDQVKVEFDVTEQMTNSWDNLHGGCTASLVDMITTIAILSHDTNKHPGVSVNLNVTYCRGAKLGETIVMDAFVEKRGRSMAFTRANLYRKADNKPIAFAEHVKAFNQAPPFSIE